MRDAFGPWTTTLGPGAGLSTFWRRRLARLASAGTPRPGLSRREALRLGLGGAALAALPTFRLEDEPTGSGEGDGPEAAKEGTIYIFASFRLGEGEEPNRGIFAIDPAANTWRKVLERQEDVIIANNFRISRDGRTFAICKYEPAGENTVRVASVWLHDLGEDGPPRKLGGAAGKPIWSPDGKQLLLNHWERKDEDGSRNDHWLIDVDGGNLTRVPIPETEEVNDWSPDGRWIVSVSNRHDDGYKLYRMRPDGTEPLRLTERGTNVFPRFSPDGKQIAFYCGENRKAHLDVMGIDGGDRVRLYEEADDTFPDTPAWSPDGRRVATVMQTWARDEEGERFLGGDENGNPQLWIFDLGGKPPRVVPLPPAEILGDPEWR